MACCLISLAGCASGEPDLGDAAEHFLAAQDALDDGDTETALSELDISIELEPDVWAYYQRARILTDQKKIDQALADCQSGLAIDPGHVELQWLAAELKKPAGRRFRGKNANPPAVRK
jgi:tetratricopeptide (TPR) repeat protein